MTNYKYNHNISLAVSAEPILSAEFTELSPDGEYHRYLAGEGATMHLSFRNPGSSTTIEETHAVSEGAIVQVRNATVLWSKPDRPVWEVLFPIGATKFVRVSDTVSQPTADAAV
jgi:hypothetical protein